MLLIQVLRVHNVLNDQDSADLYFKWQLPQNLGALEEGKTPAASTRKRTNSQLNAAGSYKLQEVCLIRGSYHGLNHSTLTLSSFLANTANSVIIVDACKAILIEFATRRTSKFYVKTKITFAISSEVQISCRAVFTLKDMNEIPIGVTDIVQSTWLSTCVVVFRSKCRHIAKHF